MNHMSRTTIAALSLLLLASTALLSGCAETKANKKETPAQEQPVSNASAPQPSPQEQPPSAAAEQPASEAAPPFDPREIKVGDKVAGMEVAKAEIVPTKDAEFFVDEANIDFVGEIEVKGTMEFYPQGFEGLDQQVLFTVDETSPFPRMTVSDHPDMKLYEKIKLIFDHPEELSEFGDKPARGEATLLIREYHIRFPGMDEEAHAMVKRIVAKNLKEATAEELKAVGED